MNNRFLIKKAYISPFILINKANIVPNFHDYPERDCVIDLERQVVVDIDMGYQYKYCKTPSMIYCLNNYKDEINTQKRIGIHSISLDIPSSDKIQKAKEIIERLSNGESYPDGNILSNEEYLSKLQEEKEKPKQKKLI